MSILLSSMQDRLLREAYIVATICNQWGDTGKGKIADILALWADVNVRGTGGPNAGHTVVINGLQRIFHLIPAGIVYDHLGKINILGNGMAIGLEGLCKELNELEEKKPYDVWEVFEDGIQKGFEANMKTRDFS